MEFVIIAVVAAVVGLVVYAIKEKAGKKSNDFKVCWAKNGWRSCYGERVLLADATDAGVTIMMDPEHQREPHYIVKPQGDMGSDQYMLISYHVAAITGDPVFYAVDAKGTDTPATFSAFFQRSGDDMYAKGDKQFYRWWSRVAIPLVVGEPATMAIPLSDDEPNWISVYGGGNSEHKALFNAAKRECAQMGLTFGGGGGRGHGVRVKGGVAEIRIHSVQLV